MYEKKHFYFKNKGFIMKNPNNIITKKIGNVKSNLDKNPGNSHSPENKFTIYEFAKKYHELGLSCIPCAQIPGDAQASKKPLLKWKLFQNQLPTESQINMWFNEKKISIYDKDGNFSFYKSVPENENLNIAIICGSVSDNLLCLDFDHPEVYELFTKHKPEYASTATAKTGKGYHVLFKSVEKLPGNWAPFIFMNEVGGETRAEGGYFIAPPSIHGNGHEYTWINPPENIITVQNIAELGIYQDPKPTDNSSTPPKKQTSTYSSIPSLDNYKVQCALHALTGQINDYDTCFRFISIMKGVFGVDYDTIDSILQGGQGYDYEKNKKLFDATTPDGRLKYGSLIYLGKKINPNGYKNKSKELKATGKLNNTSDKPLRNIEDIEDFLDENYNFKHNVVSGKIEYKNSSEDNFRIMEEKNFNSIHRDLDYNNYNISHDKLYKILNSDYVSSYNPFEDYITSNIELKDVDYIDEISDCITTTNQEMFKKYFKKWFVAMVASAINESFINHACLVLNGHQGIGKTRFITSIIPKELKEYLFIGSIYPESKDSEILLSEKLLINLDELANLTSNSSSLDSLKSLITKESISVRRPYARISENLPHRASFAGSINSLDNSFLNDMTGNRRFFCFFVTGTDINKLQKIDLKPAYYQAYKLYKNGFQPWLNKEESEEIAKLNREFEKITIEEELLLDTFRIPTAQEIKDDMYKTMTATEIVKDLQEKQSTARIKINTVGKALAKNGFERKYLDKRYCWLVIYKSKDKN